MHLTRRKLLDRLIGAGFFAAAAGFLTPVLAYLIPVKRPRTFGDALESAAGSLLTPDVVREGTGVVGRLSGHPTLVIRSQGQLLGFSAVCSHLGCMVRWNRAKRRIECPCHGGRFDLQGRVSGGPPPAPLRAIALRAEGNRIVRA